MADIFISYATSDRAVARDLATVLEKGGWSVWWDSDIPVGRAWDTVIEQEIAAARAVLVLWSPASVASDWVKNEAREARARLIMVPAFIRRTTLPLEFRHVQAADLTDWKPDETHPEFDKLVSGLRALLGEPEAVPATPSDQPPPGTPDVTPDASRDSAEAGLFVGTYTGAPHDVHGTVTVWMTTDETRRTASAKIDFAGSLRAAGAVEGTLEDQGLQLSGTLSSIQLGSTTCTLRCQWVDGQHIRGEWALEPRFPFSIWGIGHTGDLELTRTR